jgi:hypothetical protein
MLFANGPRFRFEVALSGCWQLALELARPPGERRSEPGEIVLCFNPLAPRESLDLLDQSAAGRLCWPRRVFDSRVDQT